MVGLTHRPTIRYPPAKAPPSSPYRSPNSVPKLSPTSSTVIIAVPAKATSSASRMRIVTRSPSSSGAATAMKSGWVVTSTVAVTTEVCFTEANQKPK